MSSEIGPLDSFPFHTSLVIQSNFFNFLPLANNCFKSKLEALSMYAQYSGDVIKRAIETARQTPFLLSRDTMLSSRRRIIVPEKALMERRQKQRPSSWPVHVSSLQRKKRVEVAPLRRFNDQREDSLRSCTGKDKVARDIPEGQGVAAHRCF